MLVIFSFGSQTSHFGRKKIPFDEDERNMQYVSSQLYLALVKFARQTGIPDSYHHGLVSSLCPSIVSILVTWVNDPSYILGILEPCDTTPSNYLILGPLSCKTSNCVEYPNAGGPQNENAGPKTRFFQYKSWVSSHSNSHWILKFYAVCV